MTRKGMVACLALVAVVALTAGSGTQKEYKHVTATGAILGNGTGLLRKGASYVGAAEIVVGGGSSQFVVWSSNGLRASPDTIPLGNGVALNEYFSNSGGCDSIHCLVLAVGAEFMFTTDNKP